MNKTINYIFNQAVEKSKINKEQLELSFQIEMIINTFISKDLLFIGDTFRVSSNDYRDFLIEYRGDKLFKIKYLTQDTRSSNFESLQNLGYIDLYNDLILTELQFFEHLVGDQTEIKEMLKIAKDLIKRKEFTLVNDEYIDTILQNLRKDDILLMEHGYNNYAKAYKIVGREMYETIELMGEDDCMHMIELNADETHWYETVVNLADDLSKRKFLVIKAEDIILQ